MPSSRKTPVLAVMPLMAAVFLFLAATPVSAEIPAIAVRQQTEKKDFTDAEIVDGFMKTAFGAEYHLAGRVDRIRKFDKPVRVFVAGPARADRLKQLARVTADIGHHVPNLDIALTSRRDDANVIVTLVKDRDLDKAIRKFYGVDTAKNIRRSLDPQCLSGFRKNDKYEIEHAEVILAIDAGDFVFLDCAYEELLQSLGPINDTDSVPWTMFNDDVSMGFFDIYDQFILNILYDPRIKAGMTVDEVRAMLPAVVGDVRAQIAKINDLKP
ncbi:MAG: DUF2927 domain-containing protein [Bradyrhizobiaceae bacterium]|nr:MAG: DUF2927 domain-containing protein [Bradyrhizobiaceae bacterium]